MQRSYCPHCRSPDVLVIEWPGDLECLACRCRYPFVPPAEKLLMPEIPVLFPGVTAGRAYSHALN